MNATEKALYKGMKSAGYDKFEINKVKEIIAYRKLNRYKEVTSANVDPTRVEVKLDRQLKIVYLKN